jgi:hypothetical protein
MNLWGKCTFYNTFTKKSKYYKILGLKTIAKLQNYEMYGMTQAVINYVILT